jgi:hypothetical protein
MSPPSNAELQLIPDFLEKRKHDAEDSTAAKRARYGARSHPRVASDGLEDLTQPCRLDAFLFHVSSLILRYGGAIGSSLGRKYSALAS